MIAKNTIKLLRIPFSLLLLPVFVLALSQIQTPFTFWDAFIPFFIIHFLIYPASNGYNSYVDRDEGSIGGIEKPPMPTIELFYVTLALDVIALILCILLVNWAFAACILLCVTASRAYSARQIRLKKYAILGFLTVAILQGGFTFYMTYLGISRTFLSINEVTIWVLAACSFQIAGVYPLTQIYQHEQDLADGVTTISYKLGYRGTFAFSGVMFAVCNFCYFMYFNQVGRLNDFFIIQLFFIPIVAFFGYWFLQVYRNTANANFKNTMYMNLIAAACMNICFLVLFLKN